MERVSHRSIKAVGWNRKRFSAVIVILGVLATTVSAATTQPADCSDQKPGADVVIARMGDQVVTQWQINRMVPDDLTEAQFHARKNTLVNRLIEDMTLDQYLADHPELVSEAEVLAQIKEKAKRSDSGTVEGLREYVENETDYTWEEYIQQQRRILAKTTLVRQAEKKSKNEALLREMYEEHPAEFDGTEVLFRHILRFVPSWTTPEKRREYHKEMKQLREDLAAGRISWKEAVEKSDCPSRARGGSLGWSTRHLRQPEALTEAAFSLEPNEVSDVVETYLGYHIVSPVKRREGTLSFSEAKRYMRIWLQRKPFYEIAVEINEKYPLQGVQEPTAPPQVKKSTDAGGTPADTQPATAPAESPQTKPAS